MAKHTTRIIATLCVLLPLGTTLAGEKEATLEPVIVSASQFPQNPARLSQSADIIPQKDIQNRSSLIEVLRHSPQLDIVSLGSPGEDINIRMRGSDKDEVALLIDGVPTNDVIDARAVLLEAIPLSAVERIEIVRGPSSVLYGSNAVGGIINVITKTARQAERILSTAAGNHRHFLNSAYLSQAFKNNRFALNYQRRDWGGRFNNESYARNSAYASHRLTAGEFTWDSKFLYSGTSQELAFETVTGAGIPIPAYILPDNNRRLKRDFFLPMTTLEWEPMHWYTARLTYGVYLQENSLTNSNLGETVNVAGISRGSQLFDSSAQRHFTQLQNHFTTVNQVNLLNKTLVGFEAQIERLRYEDGPLPADNTGLPSVSYPAPGQKGLRHNFAGYLQNVTELWDKIFVSMGLRFDQNSSYGRSVSPRVSAAYYNEALKTKFHAGFSKGFKAPTINEYYLTLTDSTGLLLRQKLATEESQTLEAGLKNTLLPHLTAGLTYFHVDYNNLIDELALVPRAKMQGLETSLSYTPKPWLKIEANYGLLLTRNQTTLGSLANRPTHHINARVTASPHKRLDISVQSHTVSSRLIATTLSTEAFGDLPLAYFTPAGAGYGPRLGGYTLVHADANWRIPSKSKYIKDLSAFIEARNILNNSFEDAPGYPSLQLSALAGVRASF